MIRRVLLKITAEVRTMHEAAYVLAVFAFGSTLLALVRDRLLAHTFGAGVELDIYYAAFRIPDLLYLFVATMASVFVLVPFLSQRDTDEERAAFIHTVVFFFGGLLVLLSAIMMLFAEGLVGVVFSGLVERGYGESLVLLTRILLMQPVILGISGIVASVVQYHGRYFIYALAPLLYNIGIIIGILAFVPQFGLMGLGYGVILGAVLHLAMQLPTFVSLGYTHSLVCERLRSMVAVVSVSIVRTLALTANHIALFVLVALAGTMPEGSIAIFTLALNLQAAPLAIIGASYSTAAFPTLSRLFANGDTRDFVNQVISASRHIVFWSLPMIALVVVLRAQIVRVVYGSGAFDWSDTRLTAAALALFILSLAAQGLSMLITRGYYAAGRMWKPLIISVLTAGATIALAYWFTYLHTTHEFLRNFLEALTRTTAAGSTTVLMLPLAYALSTIVGAVVFMTVFFIDFHNGTERFVRTFFESLVGAVCIGFATYAGLQLFQNMFATETLIGIFAQGAVAGTIGIVIGAIVLLAMGNKEATLVRELLHRKFWQTKPITDNQL